MIDPALLDRAVARGILSQAQARDLLHLASETAIDPAGEPPRDDEQLRFVTGFADVFVTIGLLLFLGTIAFFGGGAGPFVTAGAAWGLAEFFTRRRRMALPSIVLLAAFAAASFWSFLLASAAIAGNVQYRPAVLAIAALVAAILAALHYRRFRVPITIAAGTGALIAALFWFGLAVAPETVQRHRDGLLVLGGIAAFTLATRFDLADPMRLTRRTDIAFWLHLLAAPLIVHPVLARLTTMNGGVGPQEAGSVLGVVLVLALVALVTDRRAILVSALVYAGYAVGSLVRQAGLQDNALPATLLALGAFVLLLSAGWHPLRGLVLRALPRGLAARLPHPPGAR